MKRTGSAVWKGDLKSGNGVTSTQSGVLQDTQYSFKTRFEEGVGTNPEELIASAHASCFAMAFSKELTDAGHAPERVNAQATVNLEQKDGGFAITAVHLEVEGRVPGATQDAFDKAAQNAKVGCPVSKLLNAEITLNAKLVS